MIRIKVVLFRHPAADNIFMIFWEGIRLFSVLYQLHQVLINTALDSIQAFILSWNMVRHVH